MWPIKRCFLLRKRQNTSSTCSIILAISVSSLISVDVIFSLLFNILDSVSKDEVLASLGVLIENLSGLETLFESISRLRRVEFDRELFSETFGGRLRVREVLAHPAELLAGGTHSCQRA